MTVCVRECLCSVVRVALDRYERERGRDQEDQVEHLRTFLQEKVKPLWPRGWMQPR